MPQYFATVLPGLEHVLADELRAKAADTAAVRIERGKAWFSSRHSPVQGMHLRTADNLYQYLHRFPLGPHRAHLSEMEREIAWLDLAWIGHRIPAQFVAR